MTDQHEINPKVRSWRPRISIANLLMLIACVSLGFQVWRTHHRAELLSKRAFKFNQENRRLRDEYGEFEVVDPNLLYMVQLDEQDSLISSMRHPFVLDHKWRIYLPEPYVLNFTDQKVTKAGYPSSDARHQIQKGYHTIRLSYMPEIYTKKHEWRIELSICSQTDIWNGTNVLTIYPKSKVWPPPRYTQPKEWPANILVNGIMGGVRTFPADLQDPTHREKRRRVDLLRTLFSPTLSIESDLKEEWYQALEPDSQVPGILLWLELANR